MHDDLTALGPVLAPLRNGKDADKIWLVGGVLRDALLGRPLKDVDFAVLGDPLKAARKLGAALGARAFALDEERRIYRLVQQSSSSERVFDFSPVEGKSIEEDLARRDFTVNALGLPLTASDRKDWRKQIIDLFQGQKDLRSRNIRLTGEKVLRADPLRLLRAFRFSAELDFKLEPKTLAAIRKNAAMIKKPAAERIREELLKILVTPRAAAAFRAMDDAKLLCVLFPEAEEMRKTAHAYYGKGGVLDHSLKAMEAFEWLMERLKEFFPRIHHPLTKYAHEKMGGHPRYAYLKFTELLHDVGKPATAKVEKGKLHFYGHDYVGMKLTEEIGRRLRFSNEQTRSVARLVQSHMRPGNLGHQPVLTDRAVFRFYRDLEGDAVGMLLVSLADHFTYLTEKQRRDKKDPVINTIHFMLERYFLQPQAVHPAKVVDGNDLMKFLKLKPGPVLGRLLDFIQEAQAGGKVKTREQALSLAKEALSDVKFAGNMLK